MGSESRNRYLLKNTLIFTLGNIGSRMISFFLIPLYTNVLTTSQYGTVDLITTISTVAGPMLTLNIAESVMRFGLDKDADKEKNTQCGSIVLLIAMIIGLVLIPICRCITEVSDYAMYVYFYVISLSASQLFLCDLRGKELLLKYSLGNILQTLMIAILNITFLLVFKMETGGYLLAYIIANFIVAIYAIIAGKGYKEIRALTKQASEKTYIGGLTKECVDAFVSMVYLYDDQTMKIEFNCEDVIRRALEKYGA